MLMMSPVGHSVVSPAPVTPVSADDRDGWHRDTGPMRGSGVGATMVLVIVTTQCHVSRATTSDSDSQR